MARQFRKCVALSPLADPANPAPDADFRYPGRPGQNPSVPELFAQSKTSWIKLWADWYDMQRGGRGTIETARLYALDENVAAARAALVRTREGKQFGGIILATRAYPLWANGTAGLVVDPSDAESELRNSNDPCVQALAADRPKLIDQKKKRFPVRQLAFRFPLARPPAGESNVCLGGSQVSYDFDVGVGSDWYYWIKFLATRYNPTRAVRVLPSDDPYAQMGLNPAPDGAVIDFLEFVNEPNSTEGWPQLDAGGATISPTIVARMFATARTIRNEDLNGADGPVMVGPGTTDGLGTVKEARRTGIPCDLFTDLLLARLPAAGFRPTRNVAWSHHNYVDVTWRLSRAPVAGNPNLGIKPTTEVGKRERTNRAALVREYLLYHGWQGWPDKDPANPRLLLTEGGVRRDLLRSRGFSGQALEDEHANRLELMYELMRSSSGIGRGIAMFTQFHFYDQLGSGFDSALLDAIDEGGGAKRQPAFNRWASRSRYKG